MSSPVTQPDEGFANPRLAELYDAECPWHPQDDFYLALDLQAASVLDVGCGTGTRLTAAREAGHTGDLVGVDPAPAMLSIAHSKTDRVEWVHGDAQSLDLERTFELVTMTGHAFQVLLDDTAVRAALARFHRHLTPGGLLAFETRNPAARSWEGWRRDTTQQVVANPRGEEFEVWVDDPVTHGEDLVTFQALTRELATGERLPSSSTLRFIDPEHLRALLEEQGFDIEGWYGDWDRGPVTSTSLEVIVLARRPG
ncbi:trans-aconitate 2-methyltransferase [Nocardioides sp.]|uniref:class I SAM-dependent methyltransferase n=1 Tax=Nocardioides sp. TaxID=35761 RepID=UPI002734F43F|nr:class I SAM-dependent methyltransferase [Nocardioides sp.]MDP3890285.1 methyltransferase domain-containing protein [Nocardioides sp.]